MHLKTDKKELYLIFWIVIKMLILAVLLSSASSLHNSIVIYQKF